MTQLASTFTVVYRVVGSSLLPITDQVKQAVRCVLCDLPLIKQFSARILGCLTLGQLNQHCPSNEVLQIHPNILAQPAAQSRNLRRASSHGLSSTVELSLTCRSAVDTTFDALEGHAVVNGAILLSMCQGSVQASKKLPCLIIDSHTIWVLSVDSSAYCISWDDVLQLYILDPTSHG